jgi:hypothetical protein
MKNSLMLFLILSIINLTKNSVSMAQSSANSMPLSGAEITVNLGNQQLASGTTLPNGSFSFTMPAGIIIPKKQPVLTVYVKLPDNIQGLPQKVLSIPCQLKINVGGKSYSKNFNAKPAAKTYYGPYSQSLSNLEDNGIISVSVTTTNFSNILSNQNIQVIQSNQGNQSNQNNQNNQSVPNTPPIK